MPSGAYVIPSGQVIVDTDPTSVTSRAMVTKSPLSSTPAPANNREPRSRPPPIGTRKSPGTRAEENRAHQKEARSKASQLRRTCGVEEEERSGRAPTPVEGFTGFSPPKQFPTQQHQQHQHPPSPIVNRPSGAFLLEGESDSDHEIVFPPNQLAELKATLAKSGGKPGTSADTQPPLGFTQGEEIMEMDDLQTNQNMNSERQTPGESRSQMPGPSSPLPLNEGSFISILDSRLKSLAKSSELEELMTKIDQNAADNSRLSFHLRELETKVNDNKLSSEETIRRIVRSVMDERRPSSSSDFSLEECSSAGSGNATFRAGATSRAQEEGRVNQYNLARRSIRVWPIRGSSQSEMLDSVSDFLCGALLMSKQDVQCLRISDLRRIPPLRNSNVHNEVAFSVATPDDRDEIMRKGSFLAAYVDSNRRPTAGLRMDVPPFLESTFKLLYGVGIELRRTHGNGTRKYVKFDDENLDLFLEVRLDGRGSWLKIDKLMASDLQRESNRSTLMSARRPASRPFELSSPNSIPLPPPPVPSIAPTATAVVPVRMEAPAAPHPAPLIQPTAAHPTFGARREPTARSHDGNFLSEPQNREEPSERVNEQRWTPMSRPLS